MGSSVGKANVEPPPPPLHKGHEILIDLDAYPEVVNFKGESLVP